MSEPPRTAVWLLSHPLLVALVSGAVVGEPSIGVVVGVALTPLLAERDDPWPALAAVAGAVVAGAILSRRVGLGGILMEPWTAGLVALIGLALLAPAGTSTGPRRLAATALIGLGPVVVASVVELPGPWLGLVPWLSGLLFVVGLGRLAGAGIDARRSARSVATLASLLAANLLGPFGALVLALGVAWEAVSVRFGRWVAVANQVIVVALALAAGLLMAWLPYQIPEWETPLLRLPRREIVVDLPRWQIVVPLLWIAASVTAWRRARSGLRG